jgi:hypothetical protein
MKHDFRVDDGVSYSFNGDSHPATVVRVTNTRVWVMRDDVICTKPASGYGTEDAEYKYVRNSDARVEMFSVKKTGWVTNGWQTLTHGRHYSYNPSF